MSLLSHSSVIRRADINLSDSRNLSVADSSNGKFQMSDKSSLPSLPVVPDAPPRPLSEAAKRALAEAEARRARAAATHDAQATREFGGPDGPEPTRFGDWERKGIASDF
jgi:hypothetical protein